jgi:hypothetical protein
MRIFECLRSSGEADHGALGVAEVRDDETIGRCGRTHDASAAELFGASERGFDVGDPDVEDCVMSETRSATYSAADSGTVVGLDQVQEADRSEKPRDSPGALPDHEEHESAVNPAKPQKTRGDSGCNFD